MIFSCQIGDKACGASHLPLSSDNSVAFQHRIEFRRADREYLGAALRARRGWQMQKCCDASVCQPRQALDQLFIRIEKIVTGRLDIVEISEIEWMRERNGRAGCADGHRLPSIRRNTHECGEHTKAAGTKIRLQIIGQKILAHLSPEAGDLRVHWLATTSREPCHSSKKLRPRTKKHAYIQRCYYVSRPYLAAEPSRRRRYLSTWDPRNQLARAGAS